MLVLASKSASRRAMLAAAGVAFEIRAADIDERALEAAMDGAEPEEIAQAPSMTGYVPPPPLPDSTLGGGVFRADTAAQPAPAPAPVPPPATTTVPPTTTPPTAPPPSTNTSAPEPEPHPPPQPPPTRE